MSPVDNLRNASWVTNVTTKSTDIKPNILANANERIFFFKLNGIIGKIKNMATIIFRFAQNGKPIPDAHCEVILVGMIGVDPFPGPNGLGGLIG